jgi:hypothetical protein
MINLQSDKVKITPVKREEVVFNKYHLNQLETDYIKDNLIKHNDLRSLTIYNTIINRLDQ